jgi:hypothetical protein
LAQLPVLPLQRLDTFLLARRRARTLAVIALGLTHPATQRLVRATDHRRDRTDRRPLRVMALLLLEDQAHRALAHFFREIG